MGAATLPLAAFLVAGAWARPAAAQSDCVCFPCHGTLEDVHGDFSHSATLGSGRVVLFEDNQHDDAGWRGDRPYFGVTVDCGICHAVDLVAVHGGDCATCHPTPYDTLGLWGGGCQQGGCHAFYHQDSTIGHLPWEDSYDPANDCNLCHGGDFRVTQSACLNCHAGYTPGDTTPPVTAAKAIGEYIGPARIGFSITDNGKVGVGRTFYRLNGGPVTASGKYVFVAEPGRHTLEFWSKDQAGNTELEPNTVIFTVVEDTTPPTTTSNTQPIYYQGTTITLTATDDGTLGVKATYYRLNDGPIQTGTRVVIPAATGTISYTLAFWSEDWSGNVEAENTVTFTVTSGTGTLRLVWGDSDTSGPPCPGDPEAEASWVVRRGGWSGTVVASGSGSCPGWSGVDDVQVAVGTTPYFVIVYWWDSDYGYDEESWFGNIYVTEPGQVVRLSY
ncbi:MAG: hypothetical protein SCH98_04715 [Deferrisomatales bacterium]|nr:hypothetical protein [Deferrisomatales bacterium]